MKSARPLNPKLAIGRCRLCSLFSSPTKTLMLEKLSSKERTVGELARITGMSQSRVSQLVGIMKQQELLWARREGKFIYYSLRYPQLIEALRLIEGVLAVKGK